MTYLSTGKETRKALYMQTDVGVNACISSLRTDSTTQRGQTYMESKSNKWNCSISYLRRRYGSKLCLECSDMWLKKVNTKSN